MFPCEICSKEFARKDALRRHVRCVHDGKQYQCDICLKEFTRKDNLRRHIRCVHDRAEFSQYVCQILPDRATPIECPGINQPSAKKPRRTDPAESLDASSTESNTAANAPVHSPAKEQLKSGQKRHWKEIQYNDDEVTENNNEAFDCVQSHWSSIRSFIREGEIQSLHNFYYNQRFKGMVEKIAQAIMHNRKNLFKDNYAVGYALRYIETNNFRYYHPSNNGLFLNTALLISNREELMDFLNTNTISEEDFLDNISRTDTKWKIYQATNILFFVHDLKNAPLGGDLQLPDYIKFNRGLANVSGENDLCFFRCLAVFKGANPRRCETVCKELFSHFCSKYPVDVFPGIDFNDLPQIEDLFKINIVIYQLDEDVAKLIQKSRELYDETMRLNLYQNHLSLITDFEKYCTVYQCSNCDEL